MPDLALGGIHHVSAICGDPQRNLDFYAGLLGLRLVKRTVNFDDPGGWHLYYGDAAGRPGTLVTFFPWVAPPGARIVPGRTGTGQVTVTSLAIPSGSLDWWAARLAAAGVDADAPGERLGEPFIAFRDPDGMHLELVERPGGGDAEPFAGAPVPPERAVGALHAVTLCTEGYERTARLLSEGMGFREVARDGSRFRYAVGEGGAAGYLDLACSPDAPPGRVSVGSVHHVAFRTPDEESQLAWRERLVGLGYDVTPVMERQYFRSIYFREPAGILFEIATDGPGFATDEPPGTLGTELRLPPWLEPQRARIAARLPELRSVHAVAE